MRHTTKELVDIVHQYFPRWMENNDRDYEQSPELQRQMAARVPASQQYPAWKAMLQRLRDRFPEDRCPGVEIHNHSYFLQVPAANTCDRCFTGQLWLPARNEEEQSHKLELLVSFVVPYYTIRSEYHVPTPLPGGKLDVEIRTTFDFSPDEVPFATAMVEEILRTFPGHEAMAPEVGQTIVPDVMTTLRGFGEATIFTCLFSDKW